MTLLLHLGVLYRVFTDITKVHRVLLLGERGVAFPDLHDLLYHCVPNLLKGG